MSKQKLGCQCELESKGKGRLPRVKEPGLLGRVQNECRPQLLGLRHVTYTVTSVSLTGSYGPRPYGSTLYMGQV